METRLTEDWTVHKTPIRILPWQEGSIHYYYILLRILYLAAKRKKIEESARSSLVADGYPPRSESLSEETIAEKVTALNSAHQRMNAEGGDTEAAEQEFGDLLTWLSRFSLPLWYDGGTYRLDPPPAINGVLYRDFSDIARNWHEYRDMLHSGEIQVVRISDTVQSITPDPGLCIVPWQWYERVKEERPTAPMHTYAPVDPSLPAQAVAYVSEAGYTRTFDPGVPLIAVIVCAPVSGASQSIGEILAQLPPLEHLCRYGLYRGIIAYNGVLPPTFFAELLGYVMEEWVEERTGGDIK